MQYLYKKMASPVGILKLIASEKGLAAVLWQKDIPGQVQADAEAESSDHPILLDTEKQLNEYFARQRKSFSIDLDFEGTEFNQKVWKEMLKIPYGETRTYGDIAKQVGGMEVVRAVGGALNKNPIPIIGPCHRVVGSTGKLVGFGGGLANKAFLLRLEDEDKNPSLFPA